MVDVKTCLDNAQEKMDMAIMYLEEALAHIRAGKASARLFGNINVPLIDDRQLGELKIVTVYHNDTVTIPGISRHYFFYINQASHLLI